MYEFERNGKTIRAYNYGNARQRQMIENGWRLVLGEFRESPEDIYDRLCGTYSKIALAYSGTMVRGIHHYFAFVK